MELDGSQHQEHLAYDEQRTRYLEQRGFKIFRVWDNQAFTETQSVLETIANMLESATQQQTAPADA